MLLRFWAVWSLLCSSFLGAVELRVLDFDARPGQVAQLRVTLSAPLAAASGSFVVELDPVKFGDVAGVQVFSAAGDAVGAAEISGRRAVVRFSSVSGGVGRLAGMAVATLAVPVLAEGGRVAVAIGDVPWRDVREVGLDLTFGEGVMRGVARVGITRVFGGEVEGFGFTPETALEIPGVAVESIYFVSPTRLRFMAGTTELTGKLARVRNADGAVGDFVIGDGRVGGGALAPTFPLRRYSGFRSALVPTGLGGESGVAILNPQAVAVDVRLESIDLLGGLRGRRVLRLAPGEMFLAENLGAEGVGTWGYAGFVASLPVRAVLLFHKQYLLAGETPRRAGEVTDVYAGFVYPPVPMRASPPVMAFRVEKETAAQVAPLAFFPAVNTFEKLDIRFAVTGEKWLTVTRPAAERTELAVRVDPAGMAPGKYSGEVAVTASYAGAKPLVVPVTLEVGAAPFVSVSTNYGNYFSVEPGGAAPPVQTLSITSSGAAVTAGVEASTESGGGWLTVSAATVRTPGNVRFTVNPAGLAEGSYTGRITVTGPVNMEVRMVRLVVARAVVRRLESLRPGALRLSFPAGTEGRTVTEYVTVSPYPIPFTFSVVGGGEWLTAARLRAGIGDTVEVTVDPRGMAVGTHTGVVRFRSDAPDDVLDFPVTVTIWAGETPPLTVTPGRLVMGAGPVRFEVRSGNLPLEVRVSTEMAEGACGLWATPVDQRFQALTPLTVEVACPGTPGDYEGTVTVRAGGQTVVVPVAVHIDPVTPAPYAGIVDPPVIGAVVNAGSGMGGAVAAGEMVSLHGVGMRAAITVDGVRVAPLYAGDFQANVLLPGTVAGRVVIGVGASSVDVPVAAVAPGLFTLDGSGVGPGAILDERNVVGPVGRGEVMQVFGTGGGGRVTATVGGVAAEVLYAGSLLGLWQVNVRVPMAVAPGERVPVVLLADGVATQAGVTVAVR